MDLKTGKQIIKYLRRKGISEHSIQLFVWSENAGLWNEVRNSYTKWEGDTHFNNLFLGYVEKVRQLDSEAK